MDEIILLKLLDRIQAVSKNEILRMPNLKGRQRKISPKREWKKLNKRDRKGPKKVKCSESQKSREFLKRVSNQ